MSISKSTLAAKGHYLLLLGFYKVANQIIACFYSSTNWYLDNQILPIFTMSPALRAGLTWFGSNKLIMSKMSQCVEVLLGNINRALQDKQDINVFSSQESPDSMLFGITGVTVERDQTSVMVLGADVSGPTGVVTLRLLYLDPAQFAAREEAGEGELPGTVNV